MTPLRLARDIATGAPIDRDTRRARLLAARRAFWRSSLMTSNAVLLNSRVTLAIVSGATAVAMVAGIMGVRSWKRAQASVTPSLPAPSLLHRPIGPSPGQPALPSRKAPTTVPASQ